MKRKNVGSSLDRWLREEGTFEETTSTAIKRVLARQGEAAMKEKNVSNAEDGQADALQPRPDACSIRRMMR